MRCLGRNRQQANQSGAPLVLAEEPQGSEGVRAEAREVLHLGAVQGWSTSVGIPLPPRHIYLGTLRSTISISMGAQWSGEFF